jgi:ankyrin repeat protein
MGCAASSKPQPHAAQKSVPPNNEPENIQNVQMNVPQPQSRDINFTSGLIFIEAKGDNIDASVSIFSAVKRGDIAALKSVVAQHYNGHEHDIHLLKGMWDSTPLMVAIQYHHAEIIDYLFTFPPQDLSIFNHRNEKGASAILFAVIEGLPDVVTKLISFNVQVNLTPSTDSIYNPHFDQSAIATPLSMAVSNNQLAILKLLLANGCDANERFRFPLLKTIASTATIKKLSGAVNGASGNKSNGIIGLSPILLSCHYGHTVIVKELLTHKCDCQVKDEEGNSVLHHLARAKGVTSSNNNGNNSSSANSPTFDDPSNNPISIEEEIVHPAMEIFRYLQKEQAINESLLRCEDINGDTALHVAAENKQIEYVKLLLQEGCNPSTMNTITGLTPLHIAVKKRCVAVIECLLEFGADPLIKISDHPLNVSSPHDLSSKLTRTSEVYLIMEKAAQAWKSMRNEDLPSDAKATEIVLPELTIGNTLSTQPRSQKTTETVTTVLAESPEKNITPAPPLTSNQPILPKKNFDDLNSTTVVPSPIKENTTPIISTPLKVDIIETIEVIPFSLSSPEKVSNSSTLKENEVAEVVNILREVEANEKKVNRSPVKAKSQSPKKAAFSPKKLTTAPPSSSSKKKQNTSIDYDKNGGNDISLIDLPEDMKPSPREDISSEKTDGITTEDQVSEFQVFNESNNSFEYYDPLAYKQAGNKKPSAAVGARMDSYIKSYNPSLLLLASKGEDEDATDVLKNQSSIEEEDDEKEFFQQEKLKRKRPSFPANPDDETNNYNLETTRPTIPTNSIVAIAESIAANLPTAVERSENLVSSATTPPVGDTIAAVSEPNIASTSFAGENTKESKSSVSEKRLIPKPPPPQASNNNQTQGGIGNGANNLGGAGFRRRQNNSEKSGKSNAGGDTNKIASQSAGNASEKSKGEDIRTSEGTTTKPKLAPTAPAGKPKPPTNQNGTEQSATNTVDSKTSGSVIKPSPLNRRKLVAKS